MSKLFLRAALVGCATAGVAAAQTQPPPPPIAVPPPAVATREADFVLKTFDLGDLVRPPADSPLAKPGNDPAMQAAAKVYTQVRCDEVFAACRLHTPEALCGFGLSRVGTMEVTTDGRTLVVRNTPAVVDRVGACVESLRKRHASQVKVDVMVIKVPSANEAMVKLLGDKGHAAVSADEMTRMLRELKASGAADILSRPTLVVANKQTGYCQMGGQVPVPMPDGAVMLQPVGLTTRVTPEVSADLKSVALALEFEQSQVSRGPLTAIDSQQTKSNLVLPDGGTMAVRVGTMKAERKTECKVPVVGDLPYVGRLFHTVSTTREPVDTVAVVTVTRVDDRVVTARPPVAMAWTATTPHTPPMVTPPPPMMPTAVPVAVPAVAPAAAVFPHPVPTVRTVGPDGLERVGVNFTTLTAANTLPKAVTGVRTTVQPGVQYLKLSTGELATVTVAGGCIGTALGRTGEAADPLMVAYKAACAAGKKEEAARLALQLLAHDPTCFGK